MNMVIPDISIYTCEIFQLVINYFEVKFSLNRKYIGFNPGYIIIYTDNFPHLKNLKSTDPEFIQNCKHILAIINSISGGQPIEVRFVKRENLSTAKMPHKDRSFNNPELILYNFHVTPGDSIIDFEYGIKLTLNEGDSLNILPLEKRYKFIYEKYYKNYESVGETDFWPLKND